MPKHDSSHYIFVCVGQCFLFLSLLLLAGMNKHALYTATELPCFLSVEGEAHEWIFNGDRSEPLRMIHEASHGIPSESSWSAEVVCWRWTFTGREGERGEREIEASARRASSLQLISLSSHFIVAAWFLFCQSLF